MDGETGPIDEEQPRSGGSGPEPEGPPPSILGGLPRERPGRRSPRRRPRDAAQAPAEGEAEGSGAARRVEGIEDLAWAGIAVAAEAATLAVRLANRALESMRGSSERP